MVHNHPPGIVCGGWPLLQSDTGTTRLTAENVKVPPMILENYGCFWCLRAFSQHVDVFQFPNASQNKGMANRCKNVMQSALSNSHHRQCSAVVYKVGCQLPAAAGWVLLGFGHVRIYARSIFSESFPIWKRPQQASQLRVSILATSISPELQASNITGRRASAELGAEEGLCGQSQGKIWGNKT